MFACRRTMFAFAFVFVLVVVPAWGFVPVSPLTDCPNIPPQKGVALDQITGSWRLAYLFIDGKDNLEEDNTCGVVEIMQMNETKLEMLLYVDGKKDEYTIDRYTKDFDITVMSPGEWLLHTSFVHIEFIHVTVIALSSSHLILTFCVSPFEPEENSQPIFSDDEDAIDPENMDDIFKAQNYNKLWKELDEVNKKLERHRRIRRPSRLLRGKRFAYPDYQADDSKYEKLMKFLKESKEEKPKKHLWTAILVKDNNVSALRFVENASLLMKFGFKVTEGQLVSFGQCGLTK